jgi:hypothetical protein
MSARRLLGDFRSSSCGASPLSSILASSISAWPPTNTRVEASHHRECPYELAEPICSTAGCSVNAGEGVTRLPEDSQEEDLVVEIGTKVLRVPASALGIRAVVDPAD